MLDKVLYGADKDTAFEFQKNFIPKINNENRAVKQCFNQIVATHAGLRNDIKSGRNSNDYYYGVCVSCMQVHSNQSCCTGARHVLFHLREPSSAKPWLRLCVSQSPVLPFL